MPVSVSVPLPVSVSSGASVTAGVGAFVTAGVVVSVTRGVGCSSSPDFPVPAPDPSPSGVPVPSDVSFPVPPGSVLSFFPPGMMGWPISDAFTSDGSSAVLPLPEFPLPAGSLLLSPSVPLLCTKVFGVFPSGVSSSPPFDSTMPMIMPSASTSAAAAP